MDRLAEEIGFIQGTVGRYFPVYETRIRGEVVYLHVRADGPGAGKAFEGLRRELVPRGYIPMIVEEGGERVVVVQKRPARRYVRPWVNLAMLALTVVTTVLAGGILWAGYRGLAGEESGFGEQAALAFSPAVLPYGAALFAFPLLAILGTHEMGHYLTARHHHVAASLPFFLPAPPIIGTFGAVISMRDPIPNKRALVEIGISGPLAGLAVAIPVTLAGFYLGAAAPGVTIVNEGGGSQIGIPLLYRLLALLVPPAPERSVVHPMAFAGWVGLFVTALNLLPAGQLDGGHVARALLGERAKYVSYASIGALLVLAFLPPGIPGVGGYFGWALIGLFILLLGPRHPPPLDDLTPLGARGKALGLVAVLVIALCFVPVPFSTIPPEVGVRITVDGATVANGSFELHGLVLGVARNFTLRVNNTGNVLLRLNLSLGPRATELVAGGWTLALVGPGGGPAAAVDLVLNESEGRTVTLFVRPPASAPGSGPFPLDIVARDRRARYENALLLDLFLA